MKKITIILFALLIVQNGFGQMSEKETLIQLGKAYKDFMFRNDPDKKFIKDFKKGLNKQLLTEAEFIKQTISSNNKLFQKGFITIPNEAVLKNIFMINEVSQNMREETSVTPNELIDSLKKAQIPRYELVDNYYDMLFSGIGNKNQPFDLSKSNFKLDEYGLKDDVEKGILYLRCMAMCGMNIWGYMNVVKPPNTKMAMSFIKKYPKFNDKPYYQFTDLYFKDFEMVIIEKEASQSYKSYYINKYYEALLSHLICLGTEGASEEATRDLLLGSILKDSKLYKYTKHKETLESIFKKQ